MSDSYITDEHVESFHRDGAVLVRGLLREFVDLLCAGVERNMQQPSPQSAENLQVGDTGRFFDDYCNWSRIAEFEHVIRTSQAGAAAAALMGSNSVQLFHDHILVKEPGTSKPTPWHQGSPYYFIEGEQTVSFWVPLDPVREATLRCVVGSHRWPRPVLPVRWLTDQSFYSDNNAYTPVPDPDAEGMDVREWDMEPGDAVAFDFRTLHGARGNHAAARRRVFSLRLVGDDAHYVERPGPTSPAFPSHGMQSGDQLRDDWFPTIHRRTRGRLIGSQNHSFTDRR